MTALDETQFLLHSIRVCSSESQSPGASPPSTETLTLSTLKGPFATHILLEVGTNTHGDSCSASSSGPAASAVVRYRCPAYLAQRASSTLRNLLEDALESGAAAAQSAPTDEVPSSRGDEAVVIPLPFVAPKVFHTVAVYMDYFYGVTSAAAALAEEGGASCGAAQSASSATTTMAALSPSPSPAPAHAAAVEPVVPRQPSSLRRPLSFADLYALSAWEQGFVLRCVLGLTTEQITAHRLLQDGRWVDLLGGAEGRHSDATAKPSAAAPATLPLFGAAHRQQLWRRVTAVLEAATRLGIAALQQLCACVAANMVVDLDADGLSALMTAGPQVQRAVPPFTADARAALLQRYPWLARDEKTTAVPVRGDHPE